ncbi:MAG: Rrf2 family transcriptional regulator [Proteobacteria bacterium]|nr:Rrf2 family transcriptional regulator [Pseudomonadota bacterium]
MKITKNEEQGLRLAVYLAQKDGQCTLAELAEYTRCTQALVAKVMGKLRRGGVIRAFRGRTGGYELAAPPDSITVTSIFRSLGRPLLQGCFNSGRETADDPCPHVSECSLRPIWHHLEGTLTQMLDRITLADLIQKERDVRAHVAVLEKGKKQSRRR